MQDVAELILFDIIHVRDNLLIQKELYMHNLDLGIYSFSINKIL